MHNRKYISTALGKEMFFSGVYQILVKNTNYIYIGSCKKFGKRFKEHFVDLQANKHDNSKMQNIFNKYGIDNFSIEILELHLNYDKAYLLEREQYWIDFFKVSDDFELINISLTAQSGGTPMSEKRKKELSKKYSGKGNPNYGKTHSEEVRKEISEKLKISYEINKQKHRDRYDKLVKEGEFSRRRKEAWKNPSEATINHWKSIIERNKNTSIEDRKAQNKKYKETKSNKAGKVLISKIGDKKDFVSYQDCADYLGVSVISVRESLRKGKTCKNFNISREFEDKKLKKVSIEKETVELEFLDATDCSKYLGVSITAVCQAIKTGGLCKDFKIIRKTEN